MWFTRTYQKKVNMEEDILKDLLQNYFKNSFNVVGYVKKESDVLQILTVTYSLILILIVSYILHKRNKWNNEIKVQKEGNRKEYI